VLTRSGRGSFWASEFLLSPSMAYLIYGITSPHSVSKTEYLVINENRGTAFLQMPAYHP